MKKKANLKLLTLLIPLLIIILYVTKDYILNLVPFFPSCIFYSTFHLYCPGCGNTRSVTALLHGDIVASLRYNIIPLLLSFLLFLSYLELATYSFGKHKRILPRKLSFYMILIALIVFYLILRNFIPYLTP